MQKQIAKAWPGKLSNAGILLTTVVVVVVVLTKKIKLSMQSKYFAHQTPQSKTIFVVLEILKAVPPYGSRTAKKERV